MEFFTNLFKGRIKPGYYFGGNVFFYAIYRLIALIVHRTIGQDPTTNLIFLLPVLIITFIFSLGLVIRRLHDMDKSGWLSLLIFVPIVNLVFALWILFSWGSKEANKYGPMPSPKNFFAAIFNLK